MLIQSYFPSGDTPISVYDTIFGSFQNDPDDFIIRWDDHPLVITFNGGQILYSGDFIHAGFMNFSEECRNNEVLGTIKFWLNLFSYIGVLFGYYMFLYRGFLLMLGAASEELQTETSNRNGVVIPGRR